MKIYRQTLVLNCKHWLDKITKDSANLVQDVRAYFQPHSERDCNICNISIAKHRKLTNSHVKLFDKEFSNHQFCRYNQGASRYLIYCKPVVWKSKIYVPLTLAIRDDLTWSVCVTEGAELTSTHVCFMGMEMGIFIRWSEYEERSDFGYLNLFQSSFLFEPSLFEHSLKSELAKVCPKEYEGKIMGIRLFKVTRCLVKIS